MRYWQTPFLGLRTVPRSLTQFELHAFFSFSAAERKALSATRSRLHRLGLALHVGFLRMSGRPLSSVRVLPQELLRHLGAVLKVEVPDIASLRSLYKADRTLSHHQQVAADLLGFSRMTEHQRRALVRYLRTQVATEFNRDRLILNVKEWLYGNKLIIEHDRSLRSIIDTEARTHEGELAQTIRDSVGNEQLQNWSDALTRDRDNGESLQQWLWDSPRRQSVTQLSQQFERVALLSGLGAATQPLNCLSDHARRHFAAALAGRPPSASARIGEPRRTIEVACFIQMALYSATDTLMAMTRQAIVDLWNSAGREVTKADAERGKTLVWMVKTVRELAMDESLSEKELREQLMKAVADCGKDLPLSRAAATRERLLSKSRQIRALLARLCSLPFEGLGEQPVLSALAHLRECYADKRTELAADFTIDLGRVWCDLLDGEDRKQAFRALELGTLLGLRRALKSGAVFIAHSFAYRSREGMLIDAEEWKKHRNRHLARMKLPRDVKEFVEPLVAKVKAGLQELSQAVGEGAIRIDDEIHSQALKAEGEADEVEQLRSKLFDETADTQLPEVLLEIDSHVRFSWILLGREPRSAEELLLVYAGLLAQATALTPTDTARMMRGFSPTAIRQAIGMLRSEARMREIGRAVFEYMHSHPIAKHWGRADLASSDMMSLDVSRKVWNARTDPRRKTASMGIYTHLSARWGIFYDCPIILNQRQAGAALEGAVRQESVKLGHLAVDTHGYTDFAMLLAKLLGFDLCPRLRDLKQRKLYVPVGFEVPENLLPVSVRSLRLEPFEEWWDELTRLAASVLTGKTSAIDVMFRFGAC